MESGSYVIRQIDGSGSVVSEQHIEATSGDSALRMLGRIEQATRRINVHDASDEIVNQIGGDYWRQKYARTRRL